MKSLIFILLKNEIKGKMCSFGRTIGGYASGISHNGLVWNISECFIELLFSCFFLLNFVKWKNKDVGPVDQSKELHIIHGQSKEFTLHMLLKQHIKNPPIHKGYLASIDPIVLMRCRQSSFTHLLWQNAWLPRWFSFFCASSRFRCTKEGTETEVAPWNVLPLFKVQSVAISTDLIIWFIGNDGLVRKHFGGISSIDSTARLRIRMSEIPWPNVVSIRFA